MNEPDQKPLFLFYSDQGLTPSSPAAWFKIAFYISLLIFPMLSGYYVLSGDLDMTRSLGSSELAWTLAESHRPDFLFNADTWLRHPLALIQALHTLIFTYFSSIDLIKSILLINIGLMTASCFFVFHISKYFTHYKIAALSALLALAGHTPMLSGITGDSTALAGFFTTLSTLLALKATSTQSSKIWVIFAGLCLAIATNARIEMVFISPVIALLLLTRNNLSSALIYGLIGCSFFIAEEFLAKYFLDAHDAYSSYGNFHLHENSLSIQQWFSMQIFQEGLLGNYPPVISGIAALSSLICLASNRYRFFALIWLSLVTPVLLSTYLGSILATRPYYLAGAGIFMSGPIIALIDVIARRVVHNRMTFNILVLVSFVSINSLVVATVFSISNSLSNSPTAITAKKIKNTYVQAILPGDNFFSDHTYYWSSYFSNHAFSAGADNVYTYLRHCCASDKSKLVLGDDDFYRLTKDESHMLTSLNPKDKQLARLLWGHGFIEKYKPRFFIILGEKLYESWQKKPWNIPDTASYIRPYIVHTENGAKGKILYIDLKYGEGKFFLVQKTPEAEFILFEAIYNDSSKYQDFAKHLISPESPNK
jgi:hypothetical protein